MLLAARYFQIFQLYSWRLGFFFDLMNYEVLVYLATILIFVNFDSFSMQTGIRQVIDIIDILFLRP